MKYPSGGVDAIESPEKFVISTRLSVVFLIFICCLISSILLD